MAGRIVEGKAVATMGRGPRKDLKPRVARALKKHHNARARELAGQGLGRPEDKQPFGDHDSIAVAWMIGEMQRTGEDRPYVLCDQCYDAGVIEMPGNTNWSSVRRRIVNKFRKAMERK